MTRSKPPDPKTDALRGQGTLHPAPETVADPRFASSDFFDARDLVQTRYEMLRRVRTEGHSVTATTAWYGVSRPTFYKLLAAFEREGLWGLLPRKRGPKGRHKLRSEVMAALQAAREVEPSTDPARLVALVRERFGVDVHPRTVERALTAVPRSKKNAAERPCRGRPRAPRAPRTRRRRWVHLGGRLRAAEVRRLGVGGGRPARS